MREEDVGQIRSPDPLSHSLDAVGKSDLPLEVEAFVLDIRLLLIGGQPAAEPASYDDKPKRGKHWGQSNCHHYPKNFP